MPPLQWLRSFEAAARHLSFTAAARELHLTQSAVSQQVRLLENYIGQALFIRQPKRLELTDTALSYLGKVQEAFSTLQESTRMMRGSDRDTLLKIKANWAFTVLWLLPRLDEFANKYPWVELDLSTALWEQDYSSTTSTLEIRFGIGGWRDVEYEQLTQQYYYPVCSPKLAKRIKSLDDLIQHPLIHIMGGRDTWKSWLKNANVNTEDSVNRGHQSTTFIVTLELARKNLGITLGHDIVCQDMIKARKLAIPMEQTFKMEENYYLISGHKANRNEAHRCFSEWLVQQI